MRILQSYFEHIWKIVEDKGYVLGNVDCTIMAQRPKMAPYIEQMQNRIAELLNAQAFTSECQSDNN